MDVGWTLKTGTGNGLGPRDRSGALGASRYACMLLAAAGLQACASTPTPHLYDAALEKRTQAVGEAYATLGDEAYFRALREAFTALRAEEDAALKASLHATRDRHLAYIIRPSEPPLRPGQKQPPRGAKYLKGRVDNRLHALLGRCRLQETSDEQAAEELPADGLPEANCEGAMTAEQLDQLSALPTAVRLQGAAIRDAQARYEAALGPFAAARTTWLKGNIPEGASTPPPPPLLCADIATARGPARAEALTRAERAAIDAAIDEAFATARAAYAPREYLAVVRSCRALDEQRSELQGRLFTTLDPQPGSMLRGLLASVELARSRRDAMRAQAKVLEAAFQSLEKTIREKPSRSRFEAALAETRAAMEKAPTAARLAGQERLAVLLEDLLKAEIDAANSQAGNATAEAASADEKSAVTLRAEAVLALASGLDTLFGPDARVPPEQRTSALLLALAAQRQAVDMARLAEQREDDRLRIFEVRQAAVIAEVALLAEARRFLDGVKSDGPEGVLALTDGRERRHAQAALARYALSWDAGRVPFELGERRSIHLNRLYRISMAEKTAGNWRSLLKPAVDQLVAAGPSGVRPEALADLLGSLGIAGAVAGN